jgi:hypothetical protein
MSPEIPKTISLSESIVANAMCMIIKAREGVYICMKGKEIKKAVIKRCSMCKKKAEKRSFEVQHASSSARPASKQ